MPAPRRGEIHSSFQSAREATSGVPVAEQVVTAAQMEASLFGETFEPFEGAPANANNVAVASHYVNAVMGVIGLLEEVQYVGLAALTAPLAAIALPLPAMTLGALEIALPHTHVHPPSLIPPAPPVPLPSMGAVMASGAVSVLLGYVPAARAGDASVMLTCGTLGPPGEIVLGSSNTFFGGGRAARAGPDLTFHDNPVPSIGVDEIFSVVEGAAAQLGAVSDALQGNFAAAGMSGAQQAADSIAMAMTMMRYADCGVPPDVGAVLTGKLTVLIGGIPLPVAKGMADVVGGIASAISKPRRNRHGDAAETEHTGRLCPV